ncbi:Kidins220 [Symbiodinium sp. CCMP2592]|nr:Kidins220 [Symbiodinium sp. CCMP2592]
MDHAQVERHQGDPVSRENSLFKFPMFVVSLDSFLQLQEVQPHEALMSAGKLTEFKESLGHAIFVSHQWLANDHPDPNAEQLKVLQDALENIRSGRSNIHIPLVTEMLFGRVSKPSSKDFTGTSVYIWYDYFSCPQGSHGEATLHRQQAISSIVSYISQCKYFVILCPALTHLDQRQELGQESWAERGWCRTERLARELAARKDGATIVIESASQLYLMIDARRYLDAPGEGEFTIEEDRLQIAQVLVQIVWRKLLFLLDEGDWHGYRFLLNTQPTCIFKGLNVPPVEGLIPGFVPKSDPFVDRTAYHVEWFLHENGFRSISERDKAGWTPLCYAAMSGNSSLVQSLLEKRADCNEKMTKQKPELAMSKGMPVLSLATHFHSNEVVKVLLAARANVNARDSRHSVPLQWACHTDNLEAARILLAAGADAGIKQLLGFDSLECAVGAGAKQVTQELLILNPKVSLQFRLHQAFIFYNSSMDIVETLLEARADVNEQLRISNPDGWGINLFEEATSI